MAGGLLRCGETSAPLCSTTMGAETGETRASFNDTDDYNNLIYNAGGIENSQGQTLNLYLGYAMSVSVCNDADYDGVCNADPAINKSTAKLITVTIITPTDFSLSFSTYRVNF